jgi:RNA polymerase sigma-70 factor (ECF subfamily)
LQGDRDLIEALRQGSNAAWTELVNRYIKLVCHVVRRSLSAYSRGVAEQDVEDLAYELFSSLVRDNYRVLGTIGPPYDLKAWLAISARRRAIDFVRRKKIAAVSLDESREDEDRALRTAVAAPPAVDAGAPTAQAAALVRALGSLSPKERLIVQLFYLNGKKYREIAKMTGVNINSISPTLTRAVEKMQKYVSESERA